MHDKKTWTRKWKDFANDLRRKYDLQVEIGRSLAL